MSESKNRPAVCACGVTGPARGAPALVAGWVGPSRFGPATWLCPACVDVMLEQRRQSREYLEARRLTESEERAIHERHEAARRDVDRRFEPEQGRLPMPPGTRRPNRLGLLMALAALGAMAPTER